MRGYLTRMVSLTTMLITTMPPAPWAQSQEAVTADPDEPTVHLLLGETYEKTGLKNLALEEYGEAQFLSRISQ